MAVGFNPATTQPLAPMTPKRARTPDGADDQNTSDERQREKKSSFEHDINLLCRRRAVEASAVGRARERAKCECAPESVDADEISEIGTKEQVAHRAAAEQRRPAAPTMLHAIVGQVAALAQGGEVAQAVVAGIVIEMRTSKHDPCRDDWRRAGECLEA